MKLMKQIVGPVKKEVSKSLGLQGNCSNYDYLNIIINRFPSRPNFEYFSLIENNEVFLIILDIIKEQNKKIKEQNKEIKKQNKKIEDLVNILNSSSNFNESNENPEVNY